MNGIVRNVVANAFGGIWSILLGLIAIPLQIRILGTEAYGLIGFITTMQFILVVFDLGLPATIIREIALDHDKEYKFSRSLIQTCSTLYWLVALIIGGVFIVASNWIAVHWLKVETIPIQIVTQSLRLLAIYIVLIWPVNVYSSTIAGLQRFDIINTLKIINSSFVQIGGIVVLFLTHDLYTFIGWMTLNAFIFLIIYIWICFRLLPGLSLLPRISLVVIKQIWKFSMDLNIISTLAIIYMQADRLLISALLPLRMLGYYNAAFNISKQVSTAQDFINTPMMPALSAKTAKKDLGALNEFYMRYAKFVVYVVALPAFIMIFFSYNILNLWAGSEIALNSSAAMSLLAIGFLLNASMSTNYTLSIASGHSRIAVFVNIGALLVYIPLLVFLVTSYGITGAALGWVILNIYYLAIFVPFTQHRILESSALIWLRHILLPFILIGILVFGTGWWIQQSFSFQWAWLLSCISCTLMYTVAGFFFLSPFMRQQIMAIPRQILSRSFT